MKPIIFFCSALVLLFTHSIAITQDRYHIGIPFAVDGIHASFGADSETSEFQCLPNQNPDPPTGAFDIIRVAARTNHEILYLFLELAEPVNLQSGPKEDGTLKLLIGANGKQLTIDFRARTISDGKKNHIGWRAVDFQCLPTYASKEFEIQLNMSRLGVKVGDTVTVDFAGSDSLGKQAQIVIKEPQIFDSDKSSAANIVEKEKAENAIRIASQNTLENGLADPKRQQKFKRLLKAANADVYCFQEEWNKDKFVDGLAATFPADGRKIQYEWNGGCAIATCHDLETLPMKLDRAAAALVTFENGTSIVVISAHFKCCGYAGSNEDDLRIQQAEQIVGEIKKMRNGEFGEVAKLAPVAVVGDYNLVGSRKPLDILNEAGLKDVLCRAPGGSAYTWRGLESDESFWPGRLDWICMSATKSTKGYILDSGRLSPEQLTRLKLENDDSLASDHLTLICEFIP